MMEKTTPKTVLVTGASGFLAGHIVLKLLEQGYQVRGSVRKAARGESVRKMLETHGADTAALSFVALDLMSDTGWDAAMEGIDVLIHTASPFVTHIPKDENEVIRPAVDGTSRALNAALAGGVKRIVLTSSEVAVTRGHARSRTEPFGETDWTRIEGTDVTPYFKSKTLAERKAWEIMDAAGRHDDLSVINPGFILGPLLDGDVGTSGAIIQKMMTGKFPGAPDIYLATVDVRDTADLHIAVMADSRAFGRRVLASGPSVGMGELADMLAAEFPEFAKKLPTRHLPDFVVRLVGLFDKDARGSVRVLGRKFELDHSLAKEILGRPMISTKHAAIAMAQSQINLGLV